MNYRIPDDRKRIIRLPTPAMATYRRDMQQRTERIKDFIGAVIWVAGVCLIVFLLRPV